MALPALCTERLLFELRPGLPPQGYGRADSRRQQRVQLVIVGQWHGRHELEFQPDGPQSQQLEQPRLRLSGAVPPAFTRIPCLFVFNVCRSSRFVTISRRPFSGVPAIPGTDASAV